MDRHLLRGEEPSAHQARHRHPGRARPRAPDPKAIPPAATTGVPAARSTTWGTRAIVPTKPLCPPASLPWAMMTSTPRSTACRAWSTSMHLLDPENADIVGAGHQLARVTQMERNGGRAGGQGRGERGLVERPGLVVDDERAVGQGTEPAPLLSQLGSGRTAVPRLPSPPARQTAAASSTESQGPNGAPMIGRAMSRRSQNRVCIGAGSSSGGPHIGRTPQAAASECDGRLEQSLVDREQRRRRPGGYPGLGVGRFPVPARQSSLRSEAAQPRAGLTVPRQARRNTSTSRSVRPAGQRPSRSVVGVPAAAARTAATARPFQTLGADSRRRLVRSPARGKTRGGAGGVGSSPGRRPRQRGCGAARVNSRPSSHGNSRSRRAFRGARPRWRRVAAAPATARSPVRSGTGVGASAPPPPRTAARAVPDPIADRDPAEVLYQPRATGSRYGR